MHGDVSTNVVLAFLGVGFALHGLNCRSIAMGILFGVSGVVAGLVALL